MSHLSMDQAQQLLVLLFFVDTRKDPYDQSDILTPGMEVIAETQQRPLGAEYVSFQLKSRIFENSKERSRLLNLYQDS